MTTIVRSSAEPIRLPPVRPPPKALKVRAGVGAVVVDAAGRSPSRFRLAEAVCLRTPSLPPSARGDLRAAKQTLPSRVTEIETATATATEIVIGIALCPPGIW